MQLHAIAEPSPVLPHPAAPPSGDFADSAAASFGVHVGDNPLERRALAAQFFERNPGYVTPSATAAFTRKLASATPGLRALATRFAATPAGFGQPILDQMDWQIATGRQPKAEWWQRVNHRLVIDPVVAERAVRTDRVAELVSDSERAWAAYVQAGDGVKRLLGIDPAAPVDPASPIALSEAYRGASILDRVRARHQILVTRRAYWEAHKASIDWGRTHAMDALMRERDKDPREAEIGHGWAKIVDAYASLVPPATGHYALDVQRWALPGTYGDPHNGDGIGRRAFAWLLDLNDREYERLPEI